MDVRSRSAYLRGHVPGAVNTRYGRDGWRIKRQGVSGMLPPMAALEKLVGNLGIDNTTHVVILPGGYSAGEMGVATRIYWSLKVVGHDDVSILDGGMSAYATDKSAPLKPGMVTPARKIFKAKFQAQHIATAAYVKAGIKGDTRMVDSRPNDQYLGINKSSSVARRGTLPGAVNLPGKWVTEDDGGKFRSADVLKKLFDTVGGVPKGDTIMFCNTGHWASLGWFVQREILGNKKARMYDGSMADWSVGIRTDITDRKNYETELARHRDKLQDMVDDQTQDLIAARDESERANAAKSEFLSFISHELRTRLNAILGFSQLLKVNTSEPLSAKQQKSVSQILTSGELLLGLIEEILDLSKIETGQLELSLMPVQPDVILNECVSMAQAMAGGRDVVVSEFAMEPSRPQILIDPTRFKQVILNLLSNAVKYNRAGGTVDLNCEIRDDALRIKVVDTGPGIPEDRQQELFQPFQRLGREPSDIEGTGIGLTINKHLVELMSGDLGFITEPGAGSTFWVEFPVAGAHLSDISDTAKANAVKVSASDQGIADPNSQPNFDTNSKAPFSILYIEDNAANLALMSAMLDEYGKIDLSHAHTGEIGVENAIATPPDLILMDINLPGISGIEALHRLRENDATADVPVIAVSADAIPDHVDAAMKMGFYGYLIKPFDVRVAIDLIFEALNSPKAPAARGQTP